MEAVKAWNASAQYFQSRLVSRPPPSATRRRRASAIHAIWAHHVEHGRLAEERISPRGRLCDKGVEAFLGEHLPGHHERDLKVTPTSGSVKPTASPSRIRSIRSSPPPRAAGSADRPPRDRAAVDMVAKSPLWFKLRGLHEWLEWFGSATVSGSMCRCNAFPADQVSSPV